MKCHICNNRSIKLFNQTLLDKYSVSYYRCTHCNFIQTEEPFWLNEAYASPMARADVGLVSRNLRLSRVIHTIICAFFNPNGRFIDYGAGYGLLVRLMRDRGFNFFHYDKNCSNLLSHPFSARFEAGDKYELLTAIEVFEHLPKPLEEIKKMLACSDNIFFTTMLAPRHGNPPNDWWYYAPEAGQHISFYTADSLREIANYFNLHLCSNSKNIHLLSPRPISNSRFRYYCNYIMAYIVSALRIRRSLHDHDHRYALSPDSRHYE